LGIPENFSDPEVQFLITKIKADEINNLYLLGEKAKQRLHQILDEGKTKAIETTAILDRTFQQRRLLEGLSTQNLDSRSLVAHCEMRIKQLDQEEAKLLSGLKGMEQEENGTNVPGKKSRENDSGNQEIQDAQKAE